MSTTLPRAVHPVAWWGWAIGLAVAVSTTNNPLLLLLALAVVALVVANRRGTSPWARAFRLYLVLGLFIIVVRVVLHVLVGLKFGEIVLFHLPEVDPALVGGRHPARWHRLPRGPARRPPCSGLRLAVHHRLHRRRQRPGQPQAAAALAARALHEIGTAVVVSVSVAPQLAESVQRVRRARQLRGEGARGSARCRRVALPVLQDTLDRSLLLASAMDSRGYGRAGAAPTSHRMLTGAVTLAGLLGARSGLYGVLDTSTPAVMGTRPAAGGPRALGARAVAGRAARRAQRLPARPVAPGRSG